MRPSCLLQEGFNGALVNEVKSTICIYASWHSRRMVIKRTGINSYHAHPAHNEKKIIVPFTDLQSFFSPLLASLKPYKKERAVVMFSGNCTLMDFFCMCSQYFALHQMVDLRDLVEPVMPDDWDKYFPDAVQNQYSMSLSHDQARD